MVVTLLQAERYGTPLAQSLRVLSDESREERAMQAEEKAARLPALLTVPMIIFNLPPLFVVLIGPAIMRPTAPLSQTQGLSQAHTRPPRQAHPQPENTTTPPH